MAKHVNNYTYGRGKIYLAEESDTSIWDNVGERYVGNSPGLAINIETTSLDHMSSDGGINELDASVNTGVTRGGSMNFDDISMDNLALFFLGTKVVVTQASTPVTGETIDSVMPGLFYQLGATEANPQGVRNVSSVTVASTGGSPTTYVLNEDYEVDAAAGRIYIIPGGGITALSEIVIGYTPAAGSRDRVISGSRPKRGRMRYVEDNPAGINRTLLMPLVEIGPSGDLDLKGDAWRSMTFNIKPLKRLDFEAIYVDGNPL